MMNCFAVVAQGWMRCVAEALSWLVLLAVSLLLLAGIWRQFVLSGPRGRLLDSVALLPQWKFFGQAAIATRDDTFNDYHIIARWDTTSGDVSPWHELELYGERQWLQAVWNPQMRSLSALFEHVERLCLNADKKEDPQIQSSLAYLTVLRHCLDEHPRITGSAMQFAVVTTRGRDQRAPAIRFLSAWHTN
jgi:hypothetical protein